MNDCLLFCGSKRLFLILVNSVFALIRVSGLCSTRPGKITCGAVTIGSSERNFCEKKKRKIKISFFRIVSCRRYYSVMSRTAPYAAVEIHGRVVIIFRFLFATYSLYIGVTYQQSLCLRVVFYTTARASRY